MSQSANYLRFLVYKLHNHQHDVVMWRTSTCRLHLSFIYLGINVYNQFMYLATEPTSKTVLSISSKYEGAVTLCICYFYHQC